MNIACVLRDQARRRPGDRALVDGRRAIAFSELDAEVAGAADVLARGGLRPGDRALVFCPMSIDLYVTLIAIFRLGAVAVFVDPSAGRAQLGACCDRLRPRAFVATRRAHLLRLTSAGIRRVPLKFAIGGGVPGAPLVTARDRTPAPRDVIEPRAEDDEALITFTSGSTGAAKAAVRSHGFLLAQHGVLARDLELQAGEVDLTTLPIFVLANLASGVCSVIPDVDMRAPADADPARLIEQIRRHHAGRTAASPALLDRLVRDLAARGEQLELRRIFTGGAPVFPALLDALATVAPRASITAVYGSTEAEPIASLPRDAVGAGDRTRMRDGAGLLAGTPVTAIELRIIPDRWGQPLGPYDATGFDATSLPPGQPGEIVVSGPHVLGSYLEGRGDDESKIRVGPCVWHRTGDAGYLDPSGRLWLLGRCAARMDDALGTIYPLAVECAVSDIDGVIRTAFVQHRGRRVLVAELSAGRRPVLIQSIRARLDWAHLDDVFVVDRIPVDRRHNAKIDYPELERMMGRG